MRMKQALATTGIVALTASGAIASAPTASAEAPCVSAGVDCFGKDAPPVSGKELSCYKNGFWGGLASAITGNPLGALAGGAVGCAKGIVEG